MQPILVTGAHRSGTTWVGKTLALTRALTYVSEPLHFQGSPGVLNAEVPAWYTYICEDNGSQYFAAYQDLAAFRYHYLAALRDCRGLRDAGKTLRDGISFLTSRILNHSPLIKDPFAVFSVPWFRENLRVKTVVMVRHPVPFTSSLKRLGWKFDFQHLLNQPLLMRDWLAPYQDAMEDCLRTPRDIIGQGILLWRMIYSVVHSYRQQDPGIVILRHEDLSRQPEQEFKGLFQRLELPFSRRIRTRIQRATSPENPEELGEGNEHAIHLDSRANLRNWRTRLEKGELERILEGCAPEVGHFYQSEEWQSW